MRVSQRLDYALRAAVLLAGRPRGTYVSGAEIAMRLGLPQRVVEQQLTALARGGLLDSRRGATGGHRLARAASQISVADVVQAIEGTALDVPNVAGSVVSRAWTNAARAFEAHLARVSLDELAREQARLDATQSDHYSI